MRLFVKPVDPTAVIRDPRTKRALPAGGGPVPNDSFWQRRLRDGDVVRIADPTLGAPATAPTAVITTNRVEPTGNEPIAPLTTRKEG